MEGTRGMAQVVEHLPSKHKALSSTPNTTIHTNYIHIYIYVSKLIFYTEISFRLSETSQIINSIQFPFSRSIFQ
jgi:hypothetical protein